MNEFEIREARKSFENKAIGKVTKIISRSKFILNIGKEKVNINDKLTIFQVLEPIFDIDSKELLGFYEYVKATIYVEDVFDKYCICVSKELTSAQNPFKLTDDFEDLVLSVKEVNVNSNQNSRLDDKSYPISTGDLVKKA